MMDLPRQLKKTQSQWRDGTKGIALQVGTQKTRGLLPGVLILGTSQASSNKIMSVHKTGCQNRLLRNMTPPSLS